MNKKITLEEAEIIMDHIVETTIKKVGIDENHLIKCWESSYTIQYLCNKKLNACPMKTTAIGFKNLTHCFDVVSVSPKYSFIIDLTYKQFDTNKYPAAYIDGEEVYIKGPYKYLSENIKKELETKGYIPLTKENLVDYLYSFIKPYKVKFEIDEDFVIKETIDTLYDYEIKLCDNNDFICNTDINIKGKQK